MSCHHRVQNGSGAHPASYPMVLGAALSLGVKRPGPEDDHSPPSSVEIRECTELYIHSPNTSLWHGAQFSNKDRDNFAFLYLSPSCIHQYVVVSMC
jgi:hypothetical protein